MSNECIVGAFVEITKGRPVRFRAPGKWAELVLVQQDGNEGGFGKGTKQSIDKTIFNNFLST